MNRIKKKENVFKYEIFNLAWPYTNKGEFLTEFNRFPAKILEVALLEGIFLQQSFVISAKILLPRGIKIPGKGSQKIRRNDIDT